MLTYLVKKGKAENTVPNINNIIYDITLHLKKIFFECKGI